LLVLKQKKTNKSKESEETLTIQRKSINQKNKKINKSKENLTIKRKRIKQKKTNNLKEN